MAEVTIVENGDGTKTIRVRGNTEARFTIEGILATYDSIKMEFFKTRLPGAHVGFAEVSFGNMQRFGSDRQQGTTSIIEQRDPLGLQTYPSRIDFTLNGIRDTDISSFARVAVSARCRDPTGEPASFDFGTFYVTSVRPVDKDKTQITAEDVRAVLSKNTVYLEITTYDSIKAKLEEMFTNLNIGYYVDDVLDVNPSQDVSYVDAPPLTVLTDVSSRYAVPITIGRNGQVLLMQTDHGGRTVGSSNIMSWAMSESVEVKPNMYVFDDGATLDMRGDMTIPMVKENISNPMLATSEDKQVIVQRIVSNYALNSVSMETSGDLRIELGDTLQVQTREGWAAVTVTGIENRIGASYRQKIKGLAKGKVLF